MGLFDRNLRTKEDTEELPSLAAGHRHMEEVMEERGHLLTTIL